MKGLTQTVFGLCLLWLLVLSAVSAQEAVPRQPDASLAPQDVVGIQIEALRNNDQPSPDAGIRQTWALAHPDNQRMTGPLPRFARLLRSPGYAVLLNHRSHRIEPGPQTEDQALFYVRIIGSDGLAYAFVWVLRPAEVDGETVWLTTSVTQARVLGERLTETRPPVPVEASRPYV